ncbi:hypothetical protein GS597_01345 [Synechococcales cyanobacterium C]|uniref:Uncharacterized protein n=1 Tax=Petrachloros mirabilis ULC683 TaxID=2781853 RepID=A0A8K2A699_9CYAN|nr:hypothetical protein [Petrachloros mirabilis]NCJ05184.1 hypothetical protein [Petrachloros mirabilis ULC683]
MVKFFSRTLKDLARLVYLDQGGSVTHQILPEVEMEPFEYGLESRVGACANCKFFSGDDFFLACAVHPCGSPEPTCPDYEKHDA